MTFKYANHEGKPYPHCIAYKPPTAELVKIRHTFSKSLKPYFLKHGMVDFNTELHYSDLLRLHPSETYGQWLNENVGPAGLFWMTESRVDDSRLRFVQKDHAMLFKLTWGGNSG